MVLIVCVVASLMIFVHGSTMKPCCLGEGGLLLQVRQTGKQKVV